MKKIKYIILSLCLISLCSCSRSYDRVSRAGLYFNTIINITIYDTHISTKEKDTILDGCLQQCDYYENILSKSVEGSDIWNINHSNGTPVTVKEETATLIEKAISYALLTNGIVDPTIAGVSSLWNFTGDTPSVPDTGELSAALQHVDYHNIIIDGNTVTLKDSESSIDLGFIAKGFIADKLAEYLEENHVTSALINLGGNIYVVGNKPDGTSFQVGIQYPFGETGESITVLSIENSSMVTSGIYERYFSENNILYHHLLSTQNGYPVNNGLLSVTILSTSSVEGDALSTSCYLLGLEQGMELINSISGIEAIFITDDYTLHYSDGIALH